MKRIFFNALLVLLAVFAANAQVYFCGAANGWDINNTLQFAQNSDGLYYITVDFGAGKTFKISTVRPTATSVSDAWEQFDSGVLGVISDTELNEWITLTPGYRANITSPGADKYTLYVDLVNSKLMISDGSEGPRPSYAWSGTLPVMFINTTDNLPVDSKEVYRQGTWYLDPMGVEGVEAVGSMSEPLGLQIKGRGNYTWSGFAKKPYRLKFDQKTAVLGMDKSKHFALLAHADDNLGYMRNLMGFALSRRLGLPWTPETRPVEVVLNGDYIGLYWLTETIRVDKDRVNVVEQKDLATTDVDGGWLVEIDNYNSDPHVTVTAADGYNIWFTYKSPEELSDEQETYLSDQMKAINTAVDAGDYQGLAELVDIDCLARYYLVQQMMQDRESFHGSCYLNRQRGEAEKWMFGPVWDFGNAFNDKTGTNPVFIGDAYFYQVWISYIYQMPQFREAVKTVWQTFVSDGCNDVIDQLRPIAEEITIAAGADAARWPQYGQTDIMNKYERITSYLLNSRQWGIEQWGQSSIADVEAAACSCEPRYFNLQGIPVARPSQGQLVIKVQGNAVQKILVR